MQSIISDLIAIKAAAKEVHWNGRGPGFLAIHKFLDEVYETCDQYIDEVAEHMVAAQLYGGTPLWERTEIDSFPLAGVEDDVRVGLEVVAELLEQAVSNAHYCITEEIEDDPAGEDILVRILQDLTKHHWFADAELGN